VSDVTRSRKDDPIQKKRRREIGQPIREVRRRNNMSQEEVADYLGCSRIKVNRVENGLTDFSVVELELLAQQFNVTILHFLGIELTISVRGSKQEFSVPV
jgi:transcriptional regulator with XRE-family HTH domain